MSSCARHALDGEPSGFRLGLALLERRGVAALGSGMGAPPRTAEPLRAAPPIRVRPVPVGDELVGALASLALARVAAG